MSGSTRLLPFALLWAAAKGARDDELAERGNPALRYAPFAMTVRMSLFLLQQTGIGAWYNQFQNAHGIIWGGGLMISTTTAGLRLGFILS